MKSIQLPNGVWEYDDKKPLGKPGGFGQVFLGRSKDYAELAIKKLHLSAASAAHREMEIATGLLGQAHDHVVRFLDAGEDASTGDYYVVMEKAERSLDDDIESGVLFSPVDTAEVMFQTAQGLLEVSKLVHRDLKPGNVLFDDGK